MGLSTYQVPTALAPPVTNGQSPATQGPVGPSGSQNPTLDLGQPTMPGALNRDTPGVGVPGMPVFNGLDPTQNPGQTPAQANAARTANGVPTQPAAPGAPGGTAGGTGSTPAQANGVPTGFSKTGPGGVAAPTGMGDLLWDTKNNSWVNASAAQDRGWWNGQSAGWQAINAMPEGSPERIQAAIAYQAAHPNEPMPGQIAGYGGPSQTLKLAGQYGYSWLPQVGGEAVQMAPGLSMANSNLKEYDPNNVPKGAYSLDPSTVHAPQGTGYTDASWLASHGGATGNTPFLNPSDARPAFNINNPYTNPGSTGQGGAPGQSLGYGPGGVQQFGGSNISDESGYRAIPTPGNDPTSNSSNNNNSGLLALLGGLFGGQGGYGVQQTPYGYTQWTPTGNGGLGTNQYGIQGGGYGTGGPGTGVYRTDNSGAMNQNSIQQLLQILGGGGGNITTGSGGGGGSDANSQYNSILRFLMTNLSGSNAGTYSNPNYQGLG